MTRSELTKIIHISNPKHEIILAAETGNSKLLDLLTEQFEISKPQTEYVGYKDGKSPDLHRSYSPASHRYPVIINYIYIRTEKLISNMPALDKIPMDGLYCYQDGIFKALKEDDNKMLTRPIQL